MSDLDGSMNRSLWVYVTHSSFIEGSHMTKNTASGPPSDTSQPGVNLIKLFLHKFTYSILKAISFHENAINNAYVY